MIVGDYAVLKTVAALGPEGGRLPGGRRTQVHAERLHFRGLIVLRPGRARVTGEGLDLLARLRVAGEIIS